MKFQKQTMGYPARQLSGSARLGRPVPDKTALAGEWDFTLSFMPNPRPDSNVPDVFAALRNSLG